MNTNSTKKYGLAFWALLNVFAFMILVHICSIFFVSNIVLIVAIAACILGLAAAIVLLIIEREIFVVSDTDEYYKGDHL